jgi:hypothetical protein
MSSRLYITIARDRCSRVVLRGSGFPRPWQPSATLRSLRTSFSPQRRLLADLTKPSKISSHPSASPSLSTTPSPTESLPKKLGKRHSPSLSRAPKVLFANEHSCFFFLTALPERLVIYHAGTGRVLFLAILKLTTIALGVIFCSVLTPAYVSSDKPWWQSLGGMFNLHVKSLRPEHRWFSQERDFGEHVWLAFVMRLALRARLSHSITLPICLPSLFPPPIEKLTCALVALCGLTPLAFVAFTTGPFVTFIHMRVPTTARQSREAFQRFVRTIPPQTPLEITTLSVIAKPRVSYFTAGDLRPAIRRMGLVNYTRDTSVENAMRPWYRFRAVGEFGVHGTNRGVKEGWVWTELIKRLEKRRAAQGVSRTA